MINFEIVTLFPSLFGDFLVNLPLKRALEKNLIKVNFHNIRDFAIDKRGTVDDKPYGGGVGMVIRPEPIFDCVESIKKLPNSKIILLSPRGKRYTQEKAHELLNVEQIILISGRYEGIDARVETNLADEVISIGDYVLSGGEIPSLVIMESITRLIPGVLEKEDATKIESFETENTLEYPQYTRPEEYKGLKVPDILLSGDHKKIMNWKNLNTK